MKFHTATIKTVRHDIVKATITIQFEIDAGSAELRTADELSQYANKDAGTVVLEITPKQLPLKGLP